MDHNLVRWSDLLLLVGLYMLSRSERLIEVTWGPRFILDLLPRPFRPVRGYKNPAPT